MSKLRRRWRGGPDGTLLGVLLLVLALNGVLAYQAWDAARSHRRVTEATLGDYAAFAAWELERRVEASASAALNTAFALLRPLEGPRMGSADLVAFGINVRDALDACGCAHAVRDAFVIDLGTLATQVQDAALGPAFHAWLTDGFLEEARPALDAETMGAGIRMQAPQVQGPQPTPGPASSRVFVTGTPAGMRIAVPPPPFDSAHVVVYRGVQAGDQRSIYGFAVDVPALLGPLVEAAVAGASLLPPTLAGDFRNDEMLSAAVWLAGGDTVFRTADGGVAGGPAALDTFSIVTGPLAPRVAVRPEMADRLVIGGLPRSRVPILLGSVGLTLGLLLIAVVQLRRQQELYRLRGDFVSGVSHELRTPLAQIRLFSDLLASGQLGEMQRRRSLRILTDEAKRLTYLVETVLRFSRAEQRAGQVSPEATDVGRFLRDVVEDFGPLAESHGARIAMACPEGVVGRIDPDAMRQVMLNLLDNAVKYGPHGQTIDVTARLDGDTLRIEVDDEGPGVPAPDRERIWEPYRRLSRDVEAATGGSGIGLAVVRELVTLHGGRAFAADGHRGGGLLVVLLPAAE
jgi:signal transduction histidine kinase